MRLIVFAPVLALALAGCGPEGRREADSRRVVAGAEDPGAAWPIMLAHCMRSQKCDPLSDFGKGAGQASGQVDAAAWFAETKDAVKEGGEDYGASITINLFGVRGEGGPAGRPITMEEAPSNLRGPIARRSTLTIEYRTPVGLKPEPYGLQVLTPHFKLVVPDIETRKGEEALEAATSAHLKTMRWSDNNEGARIVVAGKAGVLFDGYSVGMAKPPGDGEARSFMPWQFYASRNLRDEPLPALLAALEQGETLTLNVTTPGGGQMLGDIIYAKGYAAALREAGEALADGEIARPIPERCSSFAKAAPEFWKNADVAAALRVCDPRSIEERRLDERGPPKDAARSN
ncbi:MAG TPA: hypothetical protein VFV70_16395 [Hyphomonadaceae bacterium]|nr:hypothetical protein [Hyphomonadaceae bacterium]